jgi:hypothetical protein
MFKVSEGDISLQLQQFLQFVPVIGSRELEGKAAKGGVGFRDEIKSNQMLFVTYTWLADVNVSVAKCLCF